MRGWWRGSAGLQSMVAVASGGALVPRLALAAAVQARTPPPSDKLAQEGLTRWRDGGGLLDNGG
jgi:phage baseplate assembly protein gpV